MQSERMRSSAILLFSPPRLLLGLVVGCNVAIVAGLRRPSDRAGSEISRDSGSLHTPPPEVAQSALLLSSWPRLFDEARQRVWRRQSDERETSSNSSGSVLLHAASLLHQRGYEAVNVVGGAPDSKDVIKLLSAALLAINKEVDDEQLQCEAHVEGLQSQFDGLRASVSDVQIELSGLNAKAAKFSKDIRPSTTALEKLRLRQTALHDSCKERRESLLKAKAEAGEALTQLQQTAKAMLADCSGAAAPAVLLVEDSLRSDRSSSLPGAGESQLLPAPPVSDVPRLAPEAPLADCAALADHLDVMVRNQARRAADFSQQVVLLDDECQQDLQQANDNIDIAEQLLGESQTQVSAALSRKSSEYRALEARTEQMKRLQEELDERQRNCKNTLGELANELEILMEARQELYLEMPDAVRGMPIQDCEVSEWHADLCSKTCTPDGEEAGSKTLQREVMLHPDSDSLEGQLGMACPPLERVAVCAEAPCPVDCTLSEWSAWSKCSSDCGGGDQYRTRSVERVGLYGGLKCDSTMQAQACNLQACDAGCHTSEWSEWGECSTRCRWSEDATAGRSRRSRQIEEEQGPSSCPSDTELEQTKDCNDKLCSELEGGSFTCGTNKDIIVLLDHTGSVLTRRSSHTAGKQDVEDRKWYVGRQKAFVEGLLNRSLLFGENSSNAGARLGALSFGGVGRPRVLSKVVADREALAAGLAEVPGPQGESTLGRGLLAALRLVEATPAVGTADRGNTLLLFSDGRVRDERIAKDAAKQLHLAGIRVMVALVQDTNLPHARPAEDVMCTIATPPCIDNVLRVRRWEDLVPQLDRFIAALCPSG
mmetsp:Transcript_63572/g.151635  ORF Transcript_63572/g.151635 Transcript_63572/m.151635 type:complete len:826 (+) Transcript_63572:40-2517(+)